MIMVNQEFLENRNINERNSLHDLLQNILPESEEEVNFIDHSNCEGLNAKFNNLKIFLSECNNNFLPLHVVTLQDTHINSNADVQYFELPGYTLNYDLARFILVV